MVKTRLNLSPVLSLSLFTLTFSIAYFLAAETNESNKQEPAVIYLRLITTNSTPAPNVN